MTEKVIGKIQYIKLTKEGIKFNKTWKLYTLKLNDKLYSAFSNGNSGEYDFYVEGDEVEIEYEQNGDYRNIKKINKYNQESKELVEKYIKEIPLNNDNKDKNNIFSTSFELNGETYIISIFKK